MNHRLLIRSGTVITQNRDFDVLEAADVLVEGGRIATMGENLPATGAEVIDASDMIVMPGMVDTHASLWWTAMRGAAFDLIGDEYFRHFLPTYRSRMRPRDVYASIRAGATNLISNGVTSALAFTHCLASPEHVKAASNALVDSGIRGALGAGLSDKQGAAYEQGTAYESVEQRFDDLMEIGESLRDNQLLSIMVALTEMEYVNIERTHKEVRFARDNGLRMTMHVNREGQIGLLQEAGLLGADMLPVHCNRQLDGEFELMAARDVLMSVTPLNEFGRGRNMSNVERAFRRGVGIALGNDLPAYGRLDLFEQMRTLLGMQGYFEHMRERVEQRTPVRRSDYPLLQSHHVLAMATRNGAKALGLEKQIGTLEVGKLADIVILSTKPFGRAIGSADFHVVQHAGADSVDTVIIGGNVVKRHGRLLHVDEDEIHADLMAARSWMLRDDAEAGKAYLRQFRDRGTSSHETRQRIVG